MRRDRYIATFLLATHAALLGWLAARHSPTIHEMAHLPAGICHWQFGMFELYRVNPPLPRMVAALPVLFLNPKTDWGNYQLDPLSRETIPMGIRFAKANGARTIFLFMVARWACIPFGLLGGWVCYRWASELWGTAAGLLSLALWCFNPLILGHGAVVMPDVPAAAMGVFAAWTFWKWLREPTWSAAALAGLALGLAEQCKTTLLVFFVLWPLAWLAYRSHHAERDAYGTSLRLATACDSPPCRLPHQSRLCLQRLVSAARRLSLSQQRAFGQHPIRPTQAGEPFREHLARDAARAATARLRARHRLPAKRF